MHRSKHSVTSLDESVPMQSYNVNVSIHNFDREPLKLVRLENELSSKVILNTFKNKAVKRQSWIQKANLLKTNLEYGRAWHIANKKT